MIKIKKGNIFTTTCHTIVNTVNCVGVMGAGIAFEFKLRFPDMYKQYVVYCEQKLIDIGQLWIYDVPSEYNTQYEKVLNFPTKYDWKYPSRIEYIEKGLDKFVNSYKSKNITSIAFPLLGADKGGLTQSISSDLIHRYLNNIDIDVELWHFDYMSKDDLFIEFKNKFQNTDIRLLSQETKISIKIIEKIKDSLCRNDINTISSLLKVKGVGVASVEKLFEFLRSQKNNYNVLTIDQFLNE
jgi:O-acetyl-ADP-ribose deacetylase (regulator of RNase III)